MINNQKISVVIPTKNEEKMIEEIINKVRPYADEVLVVDGNSSDKTREIAQEQNIRVVLDEGGGKGCGIKTAIREVKGDIIVFIDADGSHDANDIPKLIQPILEGRADHVSASRMTGGSDELTGDIWQFIRRTGSDIITLGINYYFNIRLTDSQNGFRAIKTKAARELTLKENITTIEQEMIIKSLKLGHKLTEVPSHEYVRKHGQSKINVRKVWWRYVYSWLKYLLFS